MNRSLSKMLLILLPLWAASALTSCIFFDEEEPAKQPAPVVYEEPKQEVEPVVEPVEEPVVEPEPVKAPEPVKQPEVKPVEKPAEKPVVKPVEKPVEKPVVKQEVKPEPKPVEEDPFAGMPAEEELDFVLTLVDTPAKFPGGQSALKDYMKNVKYPASAKANDIHGTVVVTAIVKDNGKIANVKVVKSLYPACDAAVMKAVYNMPRWTPATVGGMEVHSEIELPPVTF